MSYRGDIEGTITNIQRFSLHDGGGIRTCVFLKGCPFRCPWCSNPETLHFTPEYMLRGSKDSQRSEIVGDVVQSQDVVSRIIRDRIFFEESNGGATLSGGECLAQPEFALDILKGCQQERIQTAVETTLALDVKLDDFAEVVDTWLVDFKIADCKKSKEVLNLDVCVRDQNIATLKSKGANIIARMPIIPGYTDEVDCVRDNIEAICNHGIEQIDILPFHQYGSSKYERLNRSYKMKNIKSLDEADVSWIGDICKSSGVRYVINGE